MSVLARKRLPIPSGVTANVEGQTVKVKGPKGAAAARAARRQRRDYGQGRDPGRIRARDQPRARHGRHRAHAGRKPGRPASPRASRTSSRSPASAIAPRCRARTCSSRSVTATTWSIPIPEGITIVTLKPTEITITGIDKQRVGQVAAEIRDYRPPEPYKGKGGKYAGEYIFPQGRQEEVTGQSRVTVKLRESQRPRAQRQATCDASPARRADGSRGPPCSARRSISTRR